MDDCSNSKQRCVHNYREQTEVYALSVFNNITIKIRVEKRGSQR